MTKQQDDSVVGSFVWGAIFGGVVGVIGAIWFAPRSGRETRHQLQERSEHIVTEVEQTTNEVRKRIEGERVSDVLDAAKTEARQLNSQLNGQLSNPR